MANLPNGKSVLAANLRVLMVKNSHSEGYVHKKTGIAQSTVGRILRQESSATLESIDALAKLYGLQSWQLLVHELDVSNPPMLERDSEKQREFYKHIKMAAQELVKYDK